jgi:hypothetical protein
MSDDEFSSLAKRHKTEDTSDLDISPILTDSFADKSVDLYQIEKKKKISFFFSLIHETKVI